MSDIIYTPPASSGGGTTINPTNNYIPVRHNATTFIDSKIYDNGTLLSTNAYGFYIDFDYQQITIGDYDYNYNGTNLFIDDTNQYIVTQNQGSQKGIKLDFTTDIYYFGDFNGIISGCYLKMDQNNVQMQTFLANDKQGIFLSGSTYEYYFGDFNTINLGTKIIIKDNGKTISLFTDNGDINLYTAQLSILNTSTSTSAGGPSALGHLLVNINGTPCKIQLLNP